MMADMRPESAFRRQPKVYLGSWEAVWNKYPTSGDLVAKKNLSLRSEVRPHTVTERVYSSHYKSYPGILLR
jgi:hypothetical protein